MTDLCPPSSFDSVDKKSEAPTVAKPNIIVNIPNQWRRDTSRWTNTLEKIAVKIITAPESNVNKIFIISDEILLVA